MLYPVVFAPAREFQTKLWPAIGPYVNRLPILQEPVIEDCDYCLRVKFCFDFSNNLKRPRMDGFQKFLDPEDVARPSGHSDIGFVKIHVRFTC